MKTRTYTVRIGIPALAWFNTTLLVDEENVDKNKLNFENDFSSESMQFLLSKWFILTVQNFRKQPFGTLLYKRKNRQKKNMKKIKKIVIKKK